MTITRLGSVPRDAIRICHERKSGALLYLTRGGDIFRYSLASDSLTQIAVAEDHDVPNPRGMAVTSDGFLYLLGNSVQDSVNAGIIRRATIEDDELMDWLTLATTEAYPRSPGPFDHLINGFVASPDGKHLYVSVGSRTDHGEVQDAGGAYPGLREVPITASILRLPSDTMHLVIPNDSTLLRSMDLRFASGFRNTFDLEWGPGGHLFGTENSGDRDDPEELNWIQEGRHYGFPWRIGGNETPQQFADYDPEADSLIGTGVQPVFSNDPNYPSPPEGIEFVEPLENSGPDADAFRDSEDGTLLDASASGLTLRTFTPHRSPLGLVFDTAGVLADPFTGDGFVLSWTGSPSRLLDPLGDEGEDLLHLDMQWSDDDSTYQLSSTRIVQGFTHPIDAVLVSSQLYVIEMGLSSDEEPSLWRVDLPRSSTASSDRVEIPRSGYSLSIYPQPIGASGTVKLTLVSGGRVRVTLFDVRGRQSLVLIDQSLPAGTHVAPISVARMSPGVYIARMEVDGNVDFKPVVRVD